MPKVFGAAALALLAISVAGIVYTLLFTKKDPEFRMSNLPATLSKDVVASIDNYERREMDGDQTKYYIRAAKAVSFADNHQEMEDVFLEVFNEDGSASDKIAARKAIYIPAENKNFTAYFSGAVNIETRDALIVKTEQLSYTKETEIAVAEELVEFERNNIAGKAGSATVRVKEKILDLHRDVDVNAVGDNNEKAHLVAGNAVYDHANEKIELRDAVAVTMDSPPSDGKAGRKSELNAARAITYLIAGNEETREINKVELFDTVRINSVEGEQGPTQITSNYALYDKAADKFELKDAVHIVTASRGQPTNITAAYALYQQSSGKIDLTGGAEVAQTTSSVKGDQIHAELDAEKRLRLADANGNAAAVSKAPDRTISVAGPKLSAIFSDSSSIQKANVIGTSRTEIIPSEAGEYSKVTMNAQRGIDVAFKGEGLLDKIITSGRTDIDMLVPDKSPDAANKSIAADSVTTSFNANGKDMTKASAIGNAQLNVTPLHSSAANYKTSVNAPRFDCDFFTTGNDIKTCVGAVKTKTVRVPTEPSAERGTQTITSDRLTAQFGQSSKGIETLEMAGNAAFRELDRNATSEKMTYTATDSTLRLRGGSPLVWDGQARAKAPEIDWNTKDQRSELRGGASTTYYSQGKTGGATPFGSSEKPVYVTSQAANFDHNAKVAVFTGNARAWQENNYVRGEQITLVEPEGKFTAENNVQSLLYEAKRKENGTETNQPIFVAARKLTYTRNDRRLRYEDKVDIRQGKDRITGGAANVFLSESNEPNRTEIEKDVVITSPERRAAADYVRYEKGTETVFLRGNPATVEDVTRGTSQGAQMTIDLRESKMASEGTSKQNPSGRVRSVYKIKNQ